MLGIVKGLDIRIKILEFSLLLETLASTFLAMLLGMEKFTASSSLGNKSSALSFMQKINLFMDLGTIDNVERGKFDRFMAIRNQFMHNIKAYSYVNCISNLEGVENKLLKDYPSNLPTLEAKLEYAVNQLVHEVIDVSEKLLTAGEQKIKDRNQKTYQ